MNIYFSGSIASGRDKVNDYAKIVEVLNNYGKVLTMHVANPTLGTVENGITAEEIYNRDINWLEESDIVFAEISIPSLGVGYELAYAEAKNLPVICMYDEKISVSRMITGNNKFTKIPYKNIEELLEKIHEIMNKEK